MQSNSENTIDSRNVGNLALEEDENILLITDLASIKILPR